MSEGLVRSFAVMTTGGRDFNDVKVVWQTLDAVHAQITIGRLIHGACGWDADKPKTQTFQRLAGADGLVDWWGRNKSIDVVRVPARWGALGRSAGPRRNTEMVAMRPDLCIAFPGGPGTNGAIRLADGAGVPVLSSSDILKGGHLWLQKLGLNEVAARAADGGA